MELLEMVKKKIKKVVEPKAIKTYCPICLTKQKELDGIIKCEYNHKGPEGISKTEREKLVALTKKTGRGNFSNVYVQIGDDDAGDTFYRIISFKYGFLLEKHIKSPVFNPRAGKEEIKFRIDKTYHSDLYNIVRILLECEKVANRHVVTLEQLLEEEKKLQVRMHELLDQLYYISVNGDGDIESEEDDEE
jgi:hypothetical protein